MERARRGGRRQYIEGKINIWEQQAPVTSGHGKGGGQGRAPAPTHVRHSDGQLCIKTHCQITIVLLHVSAMTTCFSGSVRDSTIQLADGRGGNFVAGVATVQIVRMNAAVIKHRARQTGLSCYVSHEPLLWHPTTRQMAFTPPTTQKHATLPN